MASIEELLRKSRDELLDLSTRNRLLSIPGPSSSARIIQVQDERSTEVHRLLVCERKPMSFSPGRAAPGHASTPGLATPVPGSISTPSPGLNPTPPGAPPLPPTAGEEETGLPQPGEEEPGTGPEPLAKHHVDLRLQTSLTTEGLQRRLLDLHRDAQAMIEEQGVNVLFLALGQLRWFEEGEAGTPRHAPLILVPVVLNRRSASERFVLRWNEEDLEENLSLAAKLKTDFGITLPPFPQEDDLDVAHYLAAIAHSIVPRKGWEVLPNAITLGFFSFAKFLMYRDLTPANWPDPAALTEHPLVRGLLRDGFPAAEPPLPEDADLDTLIPAADLDHVVDADGSQTLAIESVRRGRSLVIQGPPGTGKSQSITNIIATAVLSGKSVLFVAEKLAALEVVKRRLEREGLGSLCLELHSNKSHKRAVIEEIGRTWRLGRPRTEELSPIISRLEASRAVLNGHVQSLHTPHPPGNLTPFQVLGRLTALGSRGSEAEGLPFPEAGDWTEARRLELRSLIGELADRIRRMGLPVRHPWRGVGRETMLRVDQESIARAIRAAETTLAAAVTAFATLAEALGLPAPASLAEASHLSLMASHLSSAPPMDRTALVHPAWSTRQSPIRALVSAGQTLQAARDSVGSQVTEQAWDADFTAARASIATHGPSWFRLLSGEYRRAMAEVRNVLRGDLPPTQPERLALLDTLLAGQAARRSIRSADLLGAESFGREWSGGEPDWTRLRAILDWVDRHEAAGLGVEFRRLLLNLPDPAALSAPAAMAAARLQEARECWARLEAELCLDSAGAFGAPQVEQVPWTHLQERCREWLAAPEEASTWNAYHVRARTARQSGLEALVGALETGQVPAEAAVDGFDRLCLGQVFRRMVACLPDLARFDGALHDQQVETFRELDRQRLLLAKYRVLAAHFEGLPEYQVGVGATGIVRAEMERKRGHRAVRRLLKDAGAVVQRIKPVFMMSPLSVAQFLEPGAVSFDLLVIDEASQVQPVDALGAVARARQVVVVGDTRQLPPTRFFARLTSGGEEDSEPDLEGAPQAAEVQDLESILGLCRARGLPEVMLRWHYRSRHHSLIAVSNREFYEDRLFIVPNPNTTASGLGLQFRPLPDGVFDSGGSGTNRTEARAVSRAVVDHARQTPHLSLGVAAFSVRQQQAILDEIELLRRENPDLEEFFGNQRPEPFFVKNLENVQGDERDVILLSVGYGRDAQGRFAMRFGPLGAEGGERRLNVLISRARRRCVVYSSIRAEDIDLERASGRGVAALKTFLAFAETNRLALADTSDRRQDSPFETAVQQSLQALGHEVHAQVGLAGFFIDLAVVDPDQKGRYLLGIECDGSSYEASRSARDRDRLRQAVLEDHGWVLHRIWTADWFQRPTGEQQRVEQALARARAQAASPPLPAVPHTPAGTPGPGTTPPDIEREEPLEPAASGTAALAVPYQEARFEVPTATPLHQVETRELAGVVLRIVGIEGPVHEDEVVNRVRDLWGLGRAGTRIQDAVARAIRALLVSQRCLRRDGFLTVPETKVLVRNREAVNSVSLRKPEMLPPSEIRAAILALVDASHGVAAAEIPAAVARMLGYKATGAQLRVLIQGVRETLLREGRLREAHGFLRRPED